MQPLNRRSFLAAAGAGVATMATGGLGGVAQASAEEPKFKLGLVSYNVAAGWDLPTVIRICDAVGIAAFEARTTHKHGIEPSLSKDQRREVKARFADSELKFWGAGSVCEFHSPDAGVVKKNIEECKRFCGLVADLGGMGVKVRPNGVDKSMTVDQACEQIGKALIECGKAAADAGVEITVEVHGRTTALPKNMRKIMDHCGHPSVGVTWNSNPTDLVNGSIEEGFELLAKFIRSCHIVDLTHDKSGKYPYRDLFSRFKKMGYDRYTMCEFGKSFPPEEGEKFLREYKAMWDELVKG